MLSNKKITSWNYKTMINNIFPSQQQSKRYYVRQPLAGIMFWDTHKQKWPRKTYIWKVWKSSIICTTRVHIMTHDASVYVFISKRLEWVGDIVYDVNLRNKQSIELVYMYGLPKYDDRFLYFIFMHGWYLKTFEYLSIIRDVTFSNNCIQLVLT